VEPLCAIGRVRTANETDFHVYVRCRLVETSNLLPVPRYQRRNKHAYFSTYSKHISSTKRAMQEAFVQYKVVITFTASCTTRITEHIKFRITKLIKFTVTPPPLLSFGTFAKLRKTTISFLTFVRPHQTTQLPLDGFSCNMILNDFPKICSQNSSLIKTCRYMKTCVHF